MRSCLVEMEGVVTGALPNALFRIQLDNDSQILGDISRKMRKDYCKVLIGDRVKVELTSYDAHRGLITSCMPGQRK